MKLSPSAASQALTMPSQTSARLRAAHPNNVFQKRGEIPLGQSKKEVFK